MQNYTLNENIRADIRQITLLHTATAQLPLICYSFFASEFNNTVHHYLIYVKNNIIIRKKFDLKTFLFMSKIHG